MLLIFLKSILHNLGVIVVGLGFALLGVMLDFFLGIQNFRSEITTMLGLLLIAIGFFIRVWATFHFYKHEMRVISLVPQTKLITSGPYRFSRNPLYLGGNIFIFFGASLLFGSPGALILTVINIFLVDFMIRREEKQLAKTFGKEWSRYKNRVRRWL